MNNFLPANIGTFVTLLMFVAIIPACTFAGALAAYLVQKIFFTHRRDVRLPLPVPVRSRLLRREPGRHLRPRVSDDRRRRRAAAFLIVLLGRIFWRQVKKLWAQAKAGGVILSQPRRYADPRLPALAPLVALQAGRDRDLPGRLRDPGHVRVDHVGDRLGLARQRRVRDPGAVGITQATNALALDTCCDVPQDTAVAYSTAQQLIMTAWNVLFAIVLVVWTFGWTGGKQLVGQSYTDAKGKVAEQKEQRAEKKQAKRAQREAEGGELLDRFRRSPLRNRTTSRKAARAVEAQTTARFAEPLTWHPERPRIRPARLVSWPG